MEIKISRDFSKNPGPRTEEEGSFSGERFYNEILLPQYEASVKKSEKLFIDLDDTYGYGKSFLEFSFGQLARKYGKEVFKNIEIKSDDEPYLIDEIKKYMKDAIEKK